MILNGLGVPNKAVLDTDICIIGSGPAGITLAKEFDGKPYRVILLEGGSLSRDRKSQSLYKGEDIGLHYDDLDHSRSRYFGGSSNCWGGFCRPLETQDFEARDWVPNSGWPITRNDLLPYYRKAHELLQLGPFEYDANQWQDWLGKRNARLIQFNEGSIVNMISQLSPPTRFGKTYFSSIKQSQNILLYLNSNVTEIETPGNGSKVTSVRVKTFSGSTFKVFAKKFILAGGGIDTPRLLLASNRYQSTGIGNQYDVVGRYFMDHPRLKQGTITFRNPEINSDLYNMHVTYPGEMQAQGVKVAGYFGLTPERQKAERIGGTRCYVVSRYACDDPESYAAAGHLHQALNRAGSILERSPAHIWSIIRHLPQVMVLAAGVKLKIPFLSRGYVLETIVEPSPLPDSRVTLGTQVDRLGMPRVKVDWKLGDLEKRTIRRMQQILGDELNAVGMGNVEVDAPGDGDQWPDTLKGCWHHMGTARMSNDPKKGVVNADCRVHGVENLYIAGSSVFPTCGADMPTINIVALSLRLANHIKSQS